MGKRLSLWDFEAIDWDDEDDEDGNLAHCLRHGVDERIVDQVLREGAVRIRMKTKEAEFAVVGYDYGGNPWTLLFDWSWKRGDWLRPVTGWESEPDEIEEWKRAGGTR